MLVEINQKAGYFPFIARIFSLAVILQRLVIFTANLQIFLVYNNCIIQISVLEYIVVSKLNDSS